MTRLGPDLPWGRKRVQVAQAAAPRRFHRQRTREHREFRSLLAIESSHFMQHPGVYKRKQRRYLNSMQRSGEVVRVSYPIVTPHTIACML
jgi:hypothetical protein